MTSFGLIIDYILRFVEAVLIIRVVVSWLPMAHNNQFTDLLYRVTEPILMPVRKLLQKTPLGSMGMFDFSPIVLFLLIELMRNIVRRF